VILPFNPRWIIVTVIVLVLTGGAVGGYWYYRTRPDHIYTAAENYYKVGEELRAKDQHAAAVENFERADQQLEMLLQSNKAPAFAAKGWLLRYKTRIAEARSQAIVEEQEKTPAEQRKSPEIQRLAAQAGVKAANLDPTNLEAQSAMLDSYFRIDDLDHAVEYASKVTDAVTSLNDEQLKKVKEDKNQVAVIAGAYFLLARSAWGNGGKDAKPDDVLVYVQDAHKWEQISDSRKDRWRTIDLEAKALQRKADMLVNVPRPPATAKKEADAIRNELRTKMLGWLDRARVEVEGSDRPTAPNQPPQSGVVNLSNTEGRGFFSFLLLAIDHAESRDEVMDRTQILLDAAEKVADKASADRAPLLRAASDAVAKVANYPTLLGEKRRPSVEDQQKLNERVLAINKKAREKGVAIAPQTYFDLSKAAQREGGARMKDALTYAEEGLKAAAALHVDEKSPVVLDLHWQAAWLLLLDKKLDEAKVHTAALAKGRVPGLVSYLEGLAAVLDGRLDDGVRLLNEAIAKDAHFGKMPPTKLALQYAYMAQGQYALAIPLLQDLLKEREKLLKEDMETKPWIEAWLPSLDAALMNLYRCHLLLSIQTTPEERKNPKSLKAQNDGDKYRNGQLTQAMKYLEELRRTPGGPEAELMLANRYMEEGRRLDRIDEPERAAEAKKAAEDVLDKAQAKRDDLTILWAKVRMVLSTPKTEPTLLASSVAGPLGAPSDPWLRVAEVARLRQAQAWQWQTAEHLVEDYASRHNSLPARFAWVRWLQMRGRNEEAIAYVASLDQYAKTKEEKEAVRGFRSFLEMGQGPTDETRKLIATLSHDKPDLSTEILQILYEIQTNPDPAAWRGKIEQVLGKHDQSGLLHLARAQLLLAAEEYDQAIPAFERAMQFSQFRTSAEQGLAATLARMATSKKSTVKAAFDQATRLASLYRESLAIQSACASLARDMGYIYGPQGMQGIVERMVPLIETQTKDRIAGPYLLSVFWETAGRPDLARKELSERVFLEKSLGNQLLKDPGELKTNVNFLAALVAATRLAAADEDFDKAQQYLDCWRAIAPDSIDVRVTQGNLYAATGKAKEAEKLFHDLQTDEKYSNYRAGYLGYASFLERDKKYSEALAEVKKWRAKAPGDTAGFQAEVRLLALMGKIDEAVKLAEDYRTEQKQKLDAAVERAIRLASREDKLDSDPDKAKRELEKITKNRAKAREDLERALDLTITQSTAAGLAQAKAYDLAEKWIVEKGLPLVPREPMPKAFDPAKPRDPDRLAEEARFEARKSNRLALKLMLGDMYLTQSKQAEKPEERKQLTAKALAIYKEVRAEAPANVIAANNLAWLEVKEEKNPKAALVILDEMRKETNNPELQIGGERMPLEFLDTLGVALEADERYQDALTLFNQAVQRYGQEPRVLMHQGQAQSRMPNKVDRDQAFVTAGNARDLARDRLKIVADPARKESLEKVVKDADELQNRLRGGGKVGAGGQ
jgi:hypothetical protein